jgi:hypothetical protein
MQWYKFEGRRWGQGPRIVVVSARARKTHADAVVAALGTAADAAVAASDNGRAGIDGRRGCAAAAAAGDGAGAIFIEEAEQEGDGPHEVQVDDGAPCFRLGVESAWRVFELKVAQDRRLARLGLACERTNFEDEGRRREGTFISVEKKLGRGIEEMRVEQRGQKPTKEDDPNIWSTLATFSLLDLQLSVDLVADPFGLAFMR